MINSVEDLKKFIIDGLEDKKAENITVMDLGGKTSIAKYMIFATGRSTKNVASIAEYLAQEIKNNSRLSVAIDGLETSSWVALDAGDIIVHIFHPEAREHYRIEEIWR
ncbi:MAG: ribosome silencing factor [Rickettsiaceae bacterium]|nr:ribosome silencing factor [Rickettsiaceae bacterium]